MKRVKFCINYYHNKWLLKIAQMGVLHFKWGNANVSKGHHTKNNKSHYYKMEKSDVHSPTFLTLLALDS